ncbi:hypothetical protein NE865_12881 [Phthorimaea operculella]|nr:hypothetical protein NE865_12881 [Phthorimaea operculella]
MNPTKTPPKAPMEAKTTPSVKESAEKFGGIAPKATKQGNTKTTLPAKIDTPPPGSTSTSPNATKLYKDALQQLDLSGNIKTTIKATVTNSLNGLYAVVGRLQAEKKQLQEQLNASKAKAAEPIQGDGPHELETKLTSILGEFRATREAMAEEVLEIKKLTSRNPSLSPKGQKGCDNKKVLQELGALRSLIVHDVVENVQTRDITGNLSRTPPAAFNVKLEEIKRNVIDNQKLIIDAQGQLREINNQIEENKKEQSGILLAAKTNTETINARLDNILTYAQVAASTSPSTASSPSQIIGAPTIKTTPPIHSVMVSSEGDESSDEIISKIRTAVDAKTTGIRVDRLRKARQQKVIIGCHDKSELAKITAKIQNSGNKFTVEEIRNKDPLVVIRDVLAYNSDEAIAKALKIQNGHLLDGLSEAEIRVIPKYRKKARNPHECHQVLQVSPKVWQRLTAAGKVHIDIQRVSVMDQSPVIQCTRCLAYGHGRRYCTETESTCGHCGELHLAVDCPNRATGEPPCCANCNRAGHEQKEHSAFDNNCLVRKKWDALARSAVAYC